MSRSKKRPLSFNLFSKYAFFVPGYSQVFIIALLFLVGVVLSSGLILLMSLLISTDFAVTYGQLAAYPMMFIPCMAYAASVSARNWMFDKGWELNSSNFGNIKGWQMTLIITMATFAMIFVVDIISEILPPMSPEMQEQLKILLNGPLWSTLVTVVLYAAVFEEWLCRGIILRGLLNKTHPALAILISAVFFGVIHMNLWQAIPATIIGIIFGYVYYKTGSLALTMLMHGLNNLCSVLISYFNMVPEEANSFLDILSPTAYIIIYIAAIIVLACTFIILKGIPLKGKSNCDEVLPPDFE